MASRLRSLAPYLALLILWEVAGRLDWVAGGALPAISESRGMFWLGRADNLRHVAATLQASGAGFMIGNAMAVLAGLLLVPVTGRMARGLNVAIFAVPPIAIDPCADAGGDDPAHRSGGAGNVLRDHAGDGDRPVTV